MSKYTTFWYSLGVEHFATLHERIQLSRRESWRSWTLEDGNASCDELLTYSDDIDEGGLATVLQSDQGQLHLGLSDSVGSSRCINDRTVS